MADNTIGKKFHLGDILSITTSHLVSPTSMDGVYGILNFMTGDDLFTHALPRACRVSRPYLLAEYEWLTEIDASGVGPRNWEEWLAEQIAKYGEYHIIYPILREDHEIVDPIEELKRMGIDESKIITVDVDDDEEPISPYGDLPGVE